MTLHVRCRLTIWSSLGVSGWTYLPGEDLVANLGMHDCHAAAQWTSKHIRTFGGNPDQITVVGEGAGAGIISLLTVLNGGEGILPFQQVCDSKPKDSFGTWIFPIDT